MPDYKKIICMDFDGVIHSYTSGWKGAEVIPDPPVEGAFDALKKYCQVFNVMVYSSRSKDPGGIPAMKQWFRVNGWVCTGAGDPVGLSFPTQKPPAFLTIDDRCICFEGKFPSVDEIDNFQTWQRRDGIFQYIAKTHNPTVKEMNFLKKILADDNIKISYKD